MQLEHNHRAKSGPSTIVLQIVAGLAGMRFQGFAAPARIGASRYFRAKGIPVIFVAVSLDADYGYVFVQDKIGPCFGCPFPDSVNDDTFPCPGTPAIADILSFPSRCHSFLVMPRLAKPERPRNHVPHPPEIGGLFMRQASARLFRAPERPPHMRWQLECLPSLTADSRPGDRVPLPLGEFSKNQLNRNAGAPNHSGGFPDGFSGSAFDLR